MADPQIIQEWLKKIDTRYPVHWPTQYTKAMALKAKNAAENIHDEIKNVLKSHLPNSN